MPRLGGGKSYDLQQFVWTSISAWHTLLWLASRWECPGRRLSIAPENPDKRCAPCLSRQSMYTLARFANVPALQWVHSALFPDGQGFSETLPPPRCPGVRQDTLPPAQRRDTNWASCK